MTVPSGRGLALSDRSVPRLVRLCLVGAVWLLYRLDYNLSVAVWVGLIALAGLRPIMWAGMHEAGADMMKRIAAPMIGGVITSLLLELTVYPAIFAVWKGRQLRRQAGQ